MTKKEIKQGWLIDGNGFIVDSVIDENNDINVVTVPFPTNPILIKPKWVGSEWIEGETQEEKEEREALERLNALQPSPEEVADSELEIKVLTLLMEMEVI